MTGPYPTDSFTYPPDTSRGDLVPVAPSNSGFDESATMSRPTPTQLPGRNPDSPLANRRQARTDLWATAPVDRPGTRRIDRRRRTIICPRWLAHRGNAIRAGSTSPRLPKPGRTR